MGLLFRYRYALMVIKTDPCAFSEIKIYPGRGTRFAGKDGKVHFFITSKARALFHQKIKVEDIQKKRTRKTTRVQKAIVGMSLDEIKRKRAEDETTRDKALDATKKELKARNVKKMQEKKASQAKNTKAASTKAPAAKAAPKIKQAKGSKR